MPATPFRLGFVSIHVRDLAAARAFYQDKLGLRLVKHVDEDEDFYDLGGVPLSVHVDRDGTCGRPPGGETGFYLQVDDVMQAKADLAARSIEPIWENGNALEIADPDGNTFVVWAPRGAWPPTSPVSG